MYYIYIYTLVQYIASDGASVFLSAQSAAERESGSLNHNNGCKSITTNVCTRQQHWWCYLKDRDADDSLPRCCTGFRWTFWLANK